MATDLINQSIRSTYKRTKIPRFDRVLTVLDAKDVAQEITQLGSYFLADIKDINSHNLKDSLDEALKLQLADLLHSLPPESFSFNYLALTLDFAVIRKIYVENFNTNAEYILQELKKIENTLRCKELYIAELKKLTSKVQNFPNIFEWIIAVDRVYLNTLKDTISPTTTDFNQQYIVKKIDTYNVSALYRLRLLGKKNDEITRYLIPNPEGIRLDINNGNIESLIHKILKTPTEITPDLAEKAMRIRELQYLKSGLLEGFGESFVLFYSELLSIFMYDLKLLALYQQLKTDKEDIKNRLINYDLV